MTSWVQSQRALSSTCLCLNEAQCHVICYASAVPERGDELSVDGRLVVLSRDRSSVGEPSEEDAGLVFSWDAFFVAAFFVDAFSDDALPGDSSPGDSFAEDVFSGWGALRGGCPPVIE